MSCILLTVQACSSASMYESVRYNRQVECRELPDSQYEDCMQQYQKDYKSYEQKREEVMQQDDNASPSQN